MHYNVSGHCETLFNSAASLRSVEIDLSRVETAVQYFHIDDNTSTNFSINLQQDAADSWDGATEWHLLRVLPSVTWNDMVYKPGDIIYVRTGFGESATGVFEVAEVRSLGDARSVMRGFWYYSRPSMLRKLRSTELRKWPKHQTWMKSTHTDIIMWDCGTGVLDEDDMQLVAHGKICDMSSRSWSIRNAKAEDVIWTSTC